MTRKDYVTLAAALAGEFPVDSGDALRMRMADWRGMVIAIANVCAAGNPRFDRGRFVRACEGRK